MENRRFRALFPTPKPIIGMLHVFEGPADAQLRQALRDFEALEHFVDGLIVENYDWGHRDGNRATEEAAGRIVSITGEVVARARIPVGVNLLPNDYWQALAIAARIGARFIQLDHVTGAFAECEPVDPEDYRACRARYPGIVVLGGIHPKYYTLTDPTMPLERSAATARALADAVVVTGNATGDPVAPADLHTVRSAIGNHPLVIGSGLNVANASAQLAIADGAIVGTAFKRRGVEPNEPVDPDLVAALMAEVATAHT